MVNELDVVRGLVVVGGIWVRMADIRRIAARMVT